jgi:hypothetical protein
MKSAAPDFIKRAFGALDFLAGLLAFSLPRLFFAMSYELSALSYSLGHAEVKAAASIRADLERQGKPIGPYEVLIAGTALAARGILVTHNTREFERIKSLQVEDWY